jgi:arylsulfatase A-like enzyme
MRAQSLGVLAVLLAAACDGGGTPRPSVVLVTLDTLRADHVGAYGSRARTPSLDRLAAEGAVFEHAVAPMPMTLPSHFSIFTGRYPREHGVLSNALALPESETVLTERLRDAGYATGAFVGVSLLDAASGAAQGFERFDAPVGTRQRPAEEVVPRALEWLAGQSAERPFFLWVHLFDAHLPYAPPEPFRRDLDPKLATKLPSIELASLHGIAAANGGDLPPAVLAHGQDLYRGEAEYVDHWIGRLLDALDAHPSGPAALAIVTADHGESFERGVYFEHTESLGQETLHVPLIVRHPARFAPGTRIDGDASLLDLAPTILAAVGLPPLDGTAGRSLLAPEAAGAERLTLVQHPAYSSETLANRTAMQQAMRSVAGTPTRVIRSGEDMTGVVGGGWKYLRTSAGREELYRLDDEARERSAEDPERTARMRAELERLLAEHPLHVLDSSKIDPALLEELEDLGYAR